MDNRLDHAQHLTSPLLNYSHVIIGFHLDDPIQNNSSYN